MRLPLLLSAWALVTPTVGAPYLGAQVHLQEIIDRTVARSQHIEDQDLKLRWAFSHRYQRVELDGAEVKKETQDLYRVAPQDGRFVYELIEHDGKQATAKDREREAEFRQKMRKLLGGNDGAEKSAQGLEFDREVAKRYDTEFVGRRSVDGRAMYLVKFWPREGKLPVDRRIDYVLNKTSGEFWIDSEDYQITRVDFHLLEPVRILGGLFGSIPTIDGSIDMTRLEDGLWMPERMRMKMLGRVLFSSIDQVISLEWFDFRPADQQVRAMMTAP